MYSDASLLHRIKQLNAKGAGEAVRRSLKDSLLDDALRIFEDSYSQNGIDDSPGKNEWETLLKALCDLRSVQHGIEHLESIIDICEERATLEKEAKDILSPKGFDLWRSYSHLNSEFLWRELSKILPEMCGRQYDLEEMKRAYGEAKGMRRLLHVVDSIIRNDSAGWPHPLEPWKDFLYLMLDRERSSFKFNVEDDDFGRCEFCWRLVPLQELTGQSRLFCHLHQRGSAEYNKIRKLKKVASRLPELKDWEQKGYRSPLHYLKRKANKLYKSVKSQWRLDRSNLPDEYLKLLQHNVLELQRQITKTVAYPFELLLTHFPAVVRYVRELGCDPESPLSLLQALNPEPTIGSEVDELLQKRRARLDIFSKNLVLYRMELCEAELILRAYEQFRELKNT